MARVVKSEQPLPERTKSAEVDKLRAMVARVVRVVFTLFALVLALAAFLVTLSRNVGQDDAVVRLILGFADAIDGPFSREGGPFRFDGRNAQPKQAVANWAVAAVLYLVVGRALQRLLEPKR